MAKPCSCRNLASIGKDKLAEKANTKGNGTSFSFLTVFYTSTSPPA